MKFKWSGINDSLTSLIRAAFKNMLFPNWSNHFESQSKLYDIVDGRKKETEVERREITTSDWLRDRLKLMLSHYSCLAKQEMTKAVIQLGRFQNLFRSTNENSVF